MSEYGAIIPLASYNLKLIPGIPTLAIDEDFPVSIRLTMAALDPTDPEGNEPSTLKIIKRPTDFPEDGIMYDSDEEDDEEDEDDEEEEEEEVKESKKSKKSKKEESDEEMNDDEEEEDSDEDDDLSYEIEEYVLCTLSPKTGFQQTLDLVITADEDVMFEVSGSYPIHLTGNYIEHPYIDDDSDFDFDSEDEDELDDSDYDLSPDEDEVLPPGKILELSESESEEEKPVEKPSKKEKKNKNKRAAEEEAVAAEQTKSNKKAKKTVEFNKELEQGPSGSDAKKATTQKLEGGVIIEDRTVGEGPSAKNGDKVGMRYIGKLKNGNVFDSNTKGKPFYFGLGKGEVIKGWDIGVKGMKVKGERRIVIPAALAYGKQSLPGIPANSELTFDVKLVNIK